MTHLMGWPDKQRIFRNDPDVQRWYKSIQFFTKVTRYSFHVVQQTNVVVQINGGRVNLDIGVQFFGKQLSTLGSHVEQIAARFELYFVAPVATFAVEIQRGGEPLSIVVVGGGGGGGGGGWEGKRSQGIDCGGEVGTPRRGSGDQKR